LKFEEFIKLEPFSLSGQEKVRLLTDELCRLTEWHRLRCQSYQKLLSIFHPDFHPGTDSDLGSIPWLPVGVFKRKLLSSVPEDEIFKTLISSGTTGQQPSKIILDRHTAGRQTHALAHIMKSVLGPQRLAMLLVDTASASTNKEQISARTTGLLGMMNFGRDHFFLLDDQFQLNREGLTVFLQSHQSQRIFIFGFTFMIWQYLYKPLSASGIDLSGATVIHGGGWKKLENEQVSDAEFRARLEQALKIKDVRNFYGMVEQVGSIFMQSSDGYLYTPNFAEVLIRDPKTWKVAPVGEEGVIQVLSILPLSYPGHSLLTEDLGIEFGEGQSPEGWNGKRFKILGRVPKAELRGCSDVLAASAASAAVASAIHNGGPTPR